MFWFFNINIMNSDKWPSFLKSKTSLIVFLGFTVFLASFALRFAVINYSQILASVGIGGSYPTVTNNYQQGVDGYSGSLMARISSTYYTSGKNEIGFTELSEKLDRFVLFRQEQGNVKYDSRVLLSFDSVSPAADDYRLKSASLEFHYTDFSGSLPTDIDVYPLAVEWDYYSKSLGWTNRTNSDKWATIGVAAPGSDVLPYGPYKLTNNQSSNTKIVFIGNGIFKANIDLDKSLVLNWLTEGRKPSFVMINNNTAKGIRIISNSYSDSSKRPRLSLVFEMDDVPPPPPPPPIGGDNPSDNPPPPPPPIEPPPQNPPPVATLPSPSGVVASAVSFEQVDITWRASGGAKSYKIYRDNVFVGETSALSYSDKPLKPATLYTYSVQGISLDKTKFSDLSAPVWVVTPTNGSAIVNPKRPRLLGLSQEKITYLKKLATQNDSRWVALKNEVDSYLNAPIVPWGEVSPAKPQINAGYRGSGYYDMVSSFAIAYIISGDVRYAQKAVQIMESMDQAGMCLLVSPSREPDIYAAENCKAGDSSNGYPLRFITPAMAIGYDLLHSYLTQGQKDAFAKQMQEWTDWGESGKAYQTNGPAINNFFNGYYFGLSYAAAAIGDDYPFGLDMIDRAKLKYIGIIEKEVMPGGYFEGGDQPEGSAYGSGNIRLIFGADALERTINEKFDGGDYLSSESIKFLIYATKPNRWQIVDDGEWGGNYGGLVMGGAATAYSGMLSKNDPYAGYGNYYYNNLAKPPTSALSAKNWENFAFVTEASPLDYRSWPTVFKTKGTEHVFWRTDWGENAVWADFHAGTRNFGDHDNRDAGHITLQRGNDYLIVDGGQFRQTSGYGGAGTGGGSYSHRENTLFFNDFGEYIPSSYIGGQNIYGTNNLISYDPSVDSTYVAADLMSAYEQRIQDRNEAKRSLRSYVRQVVFTKPGILMIIDDVVALKPEYEEKIRFHFGRKPIVNNNKTSVTFGSSMATIYSFGVDGEVNTTSGTHPINGMPNDPIYYIDTMASNSRNTLKTIHLVWVGDTNETIPQVSKVMTNDASLLGAFVGGYSPRVILVPGGGILGKYSFESGEYFVPEAANHEIFGLQKNANYKIYLNGVEVSQKNTNSEGRLLFSLNGSGTVRIAR